MTTPAELRQEIVRVCRRLYHSGLIAGSDGNVSALSPHGTILITPSGVMKVDLEPGDLVETDMEGRVLDGGRASSETAMHTHIYAARPDVRAIVHAHPPMATALSLTGSGIPDDILPEITFQFGEVPLVPYERPGTVMLAALVADYARTRNALLMANHGATTVGPSLVVAHARMESVEHSARIILLAGMNGSIARLSADEALALRQLGNVN
jgi:L-fuculose-phosphate aldolase